MVAYAASADEAPSAPIVAGALAAGKPLLWPRVTRAHGIEIAAAAAHELRRDASGMLAPPQSAPPEALREEDLLLVPGVAFTREGARLGRGGGHYDRLLAASRGTSIGLAFDVQLVDDLPLEPHDRGVDLVVTPMGLWRRAR